MCVYIFIATTCVSYVLSPLYSAPRIRISVSPAPGSPTAPESPRLTRSGRLITIGMKGRLGEEIDTSAINFPSSHKKLFDYYKGPDLPGQNGEYSIDAVQEMQMLLHEVRDYRHRLASSETTVPPADPVRGFSAGGAGRALLADDR